MNKIKIKDEVGINKELILPKLFNNDDESNCLANCEIDCTDVSCTYCLFDSNNYKTLLEQQKGD